jgi:hypothetical protein
LECGPTDVDNLPTFHDFASCTLINPEKAKLAPPCHHLCIEVSNLTIKTLYLLCLAVTRVFLEVSIILFNMWSDDGSTLLPPVVDDDIEQVSQ